MLDGQDRPRTWTPSRPASSCAPPPAPRPDSSAPAGLPGLLRPSETFWQRTVPTPKRFGECRRNHGDNDVPSRPDSPSSAAGPRPCWPPRRAPVAPVGPRLPPPRAAPAGTLNILVSSATGSDAGFQAVNKAFVAKYPGVKINFSAVPNENYAQAHSSRLTAGSIDVGLAGPKELPSYVPSLQRGRRRAAGRPGRLRRPDRPAVHEEVQPDGAGRDQVQGQELHRAHRAELLLRDVLQQEDLRGQRHQGPDDLDRAHRRPATPSRPRASSRWGSAARTRPG